MGSSKGGRDPGKSRPEKKSSVVPGQQSTLSSGEGDKDHQHFLDQENNLRELSRFPEENWNPVLKITVDGLVSYANARCGPVLQSWQTERNGQVPEHIKVVVQRCITRGQSQLVEVDCLAEGDGENTQCFELFFVPVQDLKAAYVYGSDITQRKKAQKELEAHRNLLEEMVKARTEEANAARDEAEQANQAKSLFLANMSHEIRTPLASIIGYAESLLEDRADEDRFNASVNTIIRSGNHLKDIINNILDLSKIEADKLEIESLPTELVDVLAEIQSLINPLAVDKGITLNIECRYPVPKNITTDPVRFKQILLNLCSNAIKFTDKGGVEIIVSYQAGDGLLLINVIDTGIGMTPQQADQVFDVFVQADVSTTRKYGGTGLGLSLSRHLAELLGGTLELQTEYGQGSCFTLSLLTAKQDANNMLADSDQHKHASSPRSSATQSQLQGRVLLAEDTPELQLLVSRYMRKMGLTVDTADNGEQAVNACLEGSYDIVFMDMQMPVMDGYTAVKMLRAQGYDKPVVAMTANAMREDKQHCLSIGCDDFIAKPIQWDTLYKIMSGYLHAADHEQIVPLISSLYETDPDMVDLVKTFLGVLPGYIDRCQTALVSENWSALGEVLHIIKGMGGCYGYDIVSTTAEAAENRLKAEDYVGTKAWVEKLGQLNTQAQYAYKQNA